MQFIKDEFKICNKGTLLAMTETWLKKDIMNAEILHKVENHDIVRCDRNIIKKAGTGEDGEKASRGGCAFIIPVGVAFKTICAYSNAVCEMIVIELVQLEKIVAVVYRPPDCSYLFLFYFMSISHLGLQPVTV